MTSSSDEFTDDKVSIAPNAFYIPSPVVLVTTMSEDGIPDISAMSAIGVTCLDPPVIAMGVKARRQTYKNIRRTGTFVVNLPLESELRAVDFTGTRPLRRNQDKVSEAGLTLGTMPGTGLPYVKECPVVMACDMVMNVGRNELDVANAPSHQTVLGQMTECLVDKKWLGDDEVLIEQMPILIYLNRVYARCGDLLGIQRFTDAPDKREQKMHEYRSLGWTDDKEQQ